MRLLQEEITGTHIAFNKAIPNMAEECRKLITARKTTTPESIKKIIPRALVFLYTVRNQRGIGHVGGDVDANGIDAATIARVTDWILWELIRVILNKPFLV